MFNRPSHQPVFVISCGFRNEVTRRPAVGSVQRKQITMTESRSGRLSSIGARQKRLLDPVPVTAFAETAITWPPVVGSSEG